ncbi:40S ribosomal protein [Salix suchowensis]|nr:40S ribosomal protein [Salix suchowensis]
MPRVGFSLRNSFVLEPARASMSPAFFPPERKSFSHLRISKKRKGLTSRYHEGVCYAKKDFNLAKHPEIDVPNLQVIKLMQSFKSKEYVQRHLHGCTTTGTLPMMGLSF